MLTPVILDHLRVVLVSTRNPLNIGAAARAMSNFGFSKLRVVKPFEPSFREAKSAVGASHILAAAEEFNTVADAVADCSLVIGTTTGRDRSVAQGIESLETAASDIGAHLTNGPVALLFGSEKRGLSNEDLAHCHWLLRIPTREEHPSMNLGQAVAVCLYEIARVMSSAESEGTHPSFARVGHQGVGHQGVGHQRAEAVASSAELERLTNALLDALHASDYIKPRTEAATEDNVRRLMRRLQLNAADAELLLGMLRKVERKLRRGDG